MARKVLLFVCLSISILLINIWWIGNNRPANQANNEGGNEQQSNGATEQDDEHPLVAPPPYVPPPPESPHQRATLGSLDPASDYVMLVTVNNRGGTIERIELNNSRFQDLEARREGRGYVGFLSPRDPLAGDNRDGIEITVVGPGTPADTAQLKVGDAITAVTTPDGQTVPMESVLDWNTLLAGDQARVGAKWKLATMSKDGTSAEREVTLAPMPLSLVAPVTAPGSGFQDPLSFLWTLRNIGPAEGEAGISSEISEAVDLLEYLGKGTDGILVGDIPPTHVLALAGLRNGDLVKTVDETEFDDIDELRSYLQRVPAGSWLKFGYNRNGAQTALVRLPAEMPEMNLHNVTWELVRPANTDNVIEFQYTDAKWNLRYTKRFTLAQKSTLEEARQGEELPPSYHLMLDLEIENLGEKRELAYQLDGLTGLPTEGWWYSSKLARGWFEGVGARDVMFEFEDQTPELIGAPAIAEFDELPTLGGEVPLKSVSGDSRYFATGLIPLRGDDVPSGPGVGRAMAIRVGTPRLGKFPRLSNTSFRLLSEPVVLDRGEKLQSSFRVFAGPKSTDLLAEPEYDLGELVYYGWPIWGVFAKALQYVLHFIHGIIPNYAIAILILTVMVRGAMFPLSRKNALGAQKMQMLQPEIRRINEKYKNNPQEKMRATQELFRKHNYHPLGGCLVLFLQLPIFIGLYRALMLDVELRQAPLIPGVTAWCDNLSAPDMLFYWGDWFMLPDMLVSETGFLGPYFNLLPVVTIALFIVQQKMFMPPPTDDQQRMQQKMMKYMMIFFAFLFFKVPAGLCLYFIASSLWGIAERKLLPKPNKPQAGGAGGDDTLAPESDGPSPRERRRMAASGGNGTSPKGQKPRTKKK